MFGYGASARGYRHEIAYMCCLRGRKAGSKEIGHVDMQHNLTLPSARAEVGSCGHHRSKALGGSVASCNTRMYTICRMWRLLVKTIAFRHDESDYARLPHSCTSSGPHLDRHGDTQGGCWPDRGQRGCPTTSQRLVPPHHPPTRHTVR